MDEIPLCTGGEEAVRGPADGFIPGLAGGVYTDGAVAPGFDGGTYTEGSSLGCGAAVLAPARCGGE